MDPILISFYIYHKILSTLYNNTILHYMYQSDMSKFNLKKIY